MGIFWKWYVYEWLNEQIHCFNNLSLSLNSRHVLQQSYFFIFIFNPKPRILINPIPQRYCLNENIVCNFVHDWSVMAHGNNVINDTFAYFSASEVDLGTVKYLNILFICESVVTLNFFLPRFDILYTNHWALVSAVQNSLKCKPISRLIQIPLSHNLINKRYPPLGEIYF